jgi:hypothetical protein
MIMKTNKYFLSVLGFFAGIIAGVSFLGLLSFSGGPGAGGGLVPITASEAKGYIGNYKADAVVNTVVTGFTIDRGQLEAMNAIARENPELAGFRVYMGKDNTSRRLGIVVGVDKAGKDAVNGTVYNTDAGSLSPCPPVCDVSSPINSN